MRKLIYLSALCLPLAFPPPAPGQDPAPPPPVSAEATLRGKPRPDSFVFLDVSRSVGYPAGDPYAVTVQWDADAGAAPFTEASYDRETGRIKSLAVHVNDTTPVYRFFVIARGVPGAAERETPIRVKVVQFTPVGADPPPPPDVKPVDPRPPSPPPVVPPSPPPVVLSPAGTAARASALSYTRMFADVFDRAARLPSPLSTSAYRAFVAAEVTKGSAESQKPYVDFLRPIFGEPTSAPLAAEAEARLRAVSADYAEGFRSTLPAEASRP